VEDRTIRFKTERRSSQWRLLAMMFFITIIALVIGLPAATSLASNPIGRTFYVRAMGDDGASGTLPEQAWKTLERVNDATFSPGDRIYFEGRATFKGTLRFRTGQEGLPNAPITVGSFGRGRAILSPDEGPGIVVHNAAGYVIQDLNIRGTGRTANHADGINFLNDLAGNDKLAFVRIRNVDISGFGEAGIKIVGTGTSGYRDVRITNSVVRDNGRAGIFVHGAFEQQGIGSGYSHADVRIFRVAAFRNSGIPGEKNHSGDGIVLGNVDGGRIEGSVAHNNGWLCDASTGPVGIWTYESRRVLIQRNVSFHNRTAGRMDGGGFGLDGGVTDSVLQFNISYGNDGAGYGLFNYDGADLPWGNNVVRYNASYSDGRKNDYGAITFYSGGPPFGLVTIFGNRIFLRGTRGKAIRF